MGHRVVTNKRHMRLVGRAIQVGAFLVFVAWGTWAQMRWGLGDGTFVGTFLPIFISCCLLGFASGYGQILVEKSKKE